MILRPGDPVALQFALHHPTTSVPSSADTLPTARLIRNGTDDAGVTVTVTAVSGVTGAYLASAMIPGGYTVGDVVQLRISATVAGTAGLWCSPVWVLDGKRLSELNDAPAAPSAAANAGAVRAELGTELGRLDAAVTSRLAGAAYVPPNNGGISTAAAAATLAQESAAAAEIAVDEVAAALAQIRGEGWTDETLKAIYDQPGASLSEEQLLALGSAVAAAISAQGVTVSSLLTAALAQIRNSVAGAVIRGDDITNSGCLTVWLGDLYGGEEGRPLWRRYARGTRPWVLEGPVELRIEVVGRAVVLTGTAVYLSVDEVECRFGAIRSTWGGLPPGEGEFRVVQRIGSHEQQTIEGGRVIVRRGIEAVA